ncbi:adaptin ear-binding coat-associated protein 2-like isoform X2 [Ruditapes philippinarum]|uniref:adaptin ear-binding coat-associated protein 2-like isoform X2 n=1 Tax=Ruditapes philippinarum TaxID=129788 RepID=UPI00295B4CDD|nr:adaptin ear-binding coat-associated protein 2-like isoform X2 [Ruditapes philippinarum]
MAGVDYESVLCVKSTVHVFRIPPRPSNRGYRASDWKLDQPDWTGRLRIVAKGKDLSIKLEDKNTGELFARCPVETYPGIAVESVMDSSRYFVLRIMDDNGRYAFIGLGFEDRGDSFDLNVALQDHFKHLKQEKDAVKAEEELQKGPKLDLGFKEGQTIRINISTKKNTEENGSAKKPRPKPSGGGGGLGFLPPPPGGVKLPPPGGAGLSLGSSESHKTQPKPQQTVSNNPPSFSSSSNSSKPNTSSNVDLLLDLGIDDFPKSQGQSSANQGQVRGFDSDFDLLSGTTDNVQPAGGVSDPWGEFTSARKLEQMNIGK